MDEKSKVTAYFDAKLMAKLKSLMKADDRSLAYLIEKSVLEMIAKPENVAKWRQVDIEEQFERVSGVKTKVRKRS